MQASCFHEREDEKDKRLCSHKCGLLRRWISRRASALYQTTLYPGVLLDAASDLKLLASERWERERYRDLWAGQFPQLHLFEKRPIRTLARELIR